MGYLANKLASTTPKTRQYLILGVVGVVILGLVASSMALMNNPAPMLPPTQSTEPQATNIATPGSAANPKDVWMEQSSAQMKDMGNIVKGLQERMDTMSGVPSTQPVAEPVLPPLPPLSSAPTVTHATSSAPMPELPQPLPAPEPKEPGIASFEVSQAAPAAAASDADSDTGYVPAGSFVRVVLLGGVEAPTGGQAQSNPYPILMRAQDNAFLPNRYRFEVKECFLLASSYGDISSERAIARLENISCILKDGRAVDVAVKGYVVGEDGMAGMRGKLIDMQGRVLANALLAGIGSGIGQAFQQAAMTQSISPLGSTSTVNGGQQLQAAVGGGFGKALDRLSQYYITLADKLYPVVEVNAGRTVEVVFTKGFKLQDGYSGKPVGTYSDIWRRGREAMGLPLDPYSNDKEPQ